MDTHDTLSAFSEWLDTEGPHQHAKTHDALAAEFIKQWEDRPGTATLAGRDPIVGQHAHSASALGLSPVSETRIVESPQHKASRLSVLLIREGRSDIVRAALQRVGANRVSQVADDRLEDFNKILERVL